MLLVHRLKETVLAANASGKKMSTEDDFGALFSTYIETAAAKSLAKTQNAKHALSEIDRQQAWHTLSYALAVDHAWPVARELLLALAPKMTRAGYWSEWIPYLERGLGQSKAMQDRRVEAEVSLHLGHLCQRLGQLERAEQQAREAVHLFALQNNPIRQGAALNRRAEIARAKRNFPIVEDLTNQALDLITSVADSGSDPDTLEEQGHAFLIKGRSAFSQQHWLIADQHFKNALRLYEQTDNLGRRAVCIQNMGRVRTMEQEYSEAIALFQHAIELLEAIDDVFNLAAVQMNLGIALSLSGRPYDALEQYAAAELVFRRLHERLHLAKNLNNQGMEMNNLGRWSEAEKLLMASSALCLQLDNLQEYINAQDGLGLTYMGRGDYARAIKVFEQALELSEERAERNFSKSTLADLTEHLQHAKMKCEAHT